MTAWQSLVRPALIASALGTVPFVAVKAGEKVLTNGSIIHFSHGEYAILCAILATGLWLTNVVVLIGSTAAARRRALLFALIATTAFSAIGTLVEPSLWANLLRPVESGIGYWAFLTGICSTLLFLLNTSGQKANVH